MAARIQTLKSSPTTAAIRGPADLDVLRERLGLETAADLAVLLGLHESTLSRFYRGHHLELSRAAQLRAELILRALNHGASPTDILTCAVEETGDGVMDRPLVEVVTRLVALFLGVEYPRPRADYLRAREKRAHRDEEES